MIGKFATASAVTLLALTASVGRRGFRSNDSRRQAPTNSRASTSCRPAAICHANAEPTRRLSEEESISRRRASLATIRTGISTWALGANLDTGTTKTFVRGGGPLVGAAGVARNANRYLGLRADFIFADLPLRHSTLELAQAGSASSYLFALDVGPVINIPVTKEWGGYILFGGGYYHRWGTLRFQHNCSGFWSAMPSLTGGAHARAQVFRSAEVS